MRRWSVEEFYGLVRHDLTDRKGPVELIEGCIVPLPVSEQLERQVERLRQQIQHYFDQSALKGLEVRSHHPIRINPHSELRPTLTILSTHCPQPLIQWVIEIDKSDIDEPTPADSNSQHLREQLYAHYGITEYWALSTEQVELRTYHTPKSYPPSTATDQDDGKPIALHQPSYQHQQLWHVGEQVHSTSFPQLTMQIQEPLPLYFLTRTATGNRTYVENRLPLSLEPSCFALESERSLRGRATPLRG